MARVRTSIYGTIYNNANVVDKAVDSLVSVLPWFEQEYEVVIVDNLSNDGTWESLQKWGKKFKNVRLTRAKASRGRGRDLALRRTRGKYVCYVDFDVIFRTEFGTLLRELEKICREGEFYNYAFSTRETSLAIGGWRDLNFGEDWEFFARAIAKGMKVRHVLVPSFFLNERVVGNREHRYSRTYGALLLRNIRNFADTVKAWNLHPSFFLHSFLPGLPTSRGLPVYLLVYPLAALRRYVYSQGLTNHEYVLLNTEYLYPEDVNLSSEYLFAPFTPNSDRPEIVKKRIHEIRTAKKDLGVIEKGGCCVLHKHLDTVKEYVEEFFVFQARFGRKHPALLMSAPHE